MSVAGLGPRPAQALILGYLGVILTGALLLSTPAAASGTRPVSAVDALFTATSAVCVTGLVSVDTETAWSGLGQAVILVLIQIGGLGIMTVSTFLLLALGRRLGMTAREATGDPLGVGTGPRLGPTLKAVFAATAFFELCGAILLWLTWTFSGGPAARWGALERAWHALFHSVSAFCNAGFSTMSASLAGFAGNYVTNLIMMALIIIGGIGFVVIIDLRRCLAPGPGRRSARLSAHTKLVLIVTAVLIPAGALLLYVCERGNPATLGRLTAGQRFMACLFQSVSARTAGFNTVPISGMTPGALFVMLLLMIVGASPCSTGGGIKTTALGVMVATAWSRLRGREEVHCFGRTVSREAITRTGSLVVLSLGMIAAILLVLLVSGGVRAGLEQAFLQSAFEVVSAFGTVGLSTGVTPDLAVHGKLLIMLTMLVGRTGPLVAAVAISRQQRRQLVRLPDGEILVG